MLYKVTENQVASKNGQSRETDNIGYTGHLTKTKKTKTQHRKINKR